MSTETRLKCDGCGAYYRTTCSARAVNRVRLEAASVGWKTIDASRDYCPDCHTGGKVKKRLGGVAR